MSGFSRKTEEAETTLPYGLPIGGTLKQTYRIERMIAVSGMGAVYEARHVRLDRRVAIKVLLDDGDWSPALVARLRREAAMVAQLEHPHIVQVLDVDETDGGVPYLVMEYLEGETLAARLSRSGPFGVVEALRITSDVAAALAQVHARGIVHCDLKPANVFLVKVEDEPDFVKVFDFGVSRETTRARGSSSVIAGTPEYMAPEQRAGHLDLDARVDQFGLAAVVYEMLSGKRLDSGGRLLEQVPALSESAPWLPGAFDAVIRRALSTSPEERFASVSRFAWELENAGLRAGFDPDDARWLPSWAPGPQPAMDTVDTLLDSASRSYERGEFDTAVLYTERILDLALHQGDAKTLRLLSSRMDLLDTIFDARVRPFEQALAIGTVSPPFFKRLSLHAREILALVETPMSVDQILARSAIPRRDCVRLVAGLLRRGVLIPEDRAVRESAATQLA